MDLPKRSSKHLRILEVAYISPSVLFNKTKTIQKCRNLFMSDPLLQRLGLVYSALNLILLESEVCPGISHDNHPKILGEVLMNG